MKTIGVLAVAVCFMIADAMVARRAKAASSDMILPGRSELRLTDSSGNAYVLIKNPKKRGNRKSRNGRRRSRNGRRPTTTTEDPCKDSRRKRSAGGPVVIPNAGFMAIDPCDPDFDFPIGPVPT